jgi:glycerate kinase
MASELGFNFLDERGRIIQPIGSNLSKIAKINGHLLYPKTKFIAINDVNNILYGENGAALNYAKQKGASTKEILYLESGLRHLDQIVIAQLGKNVADTPGAGAAGGSGYGIKIFMNGSFISGNDFFFKIAKIEALMEREKIDFIITGEGSIDSLSLKGKLIQGIAKLAKPNGVKVVAICGNLDLTAAEISQMGLYFATPIAPKGVSTEESIKKASQYVTDSVKRILQKMKSY